VYLAANLDRAVEIRDTLRKRPIVQSIVVVTVADEWRRDEKKKRRGSKSNARSR
jgi:hypothetical protein